MALFELSISYDVKVNYIFSLVLIFPIVETFKGGRHSTEATFWQHIAFYIVARTKCNCIS